MELGQGESSRVIEKSLVVKDLGIMISSDFNECPKLKKLIKQQKQ